MNKNLRIFLPLICAATAVSLVGCSGGGGGRKSPNGGGTATNVFPPPANATNQGSIPTTGGDLGINNVATITFPTGSFVAPTTAKISATATTATAADFNSTAFLFSPDSKRLYEIRVNTGKSKPSKTGTIVVNIPDGYATTVPSGYGIEAFIQLIEVGGGDALDLFELVGSNYDATAKTITFQVPSEAFTNERTANGTYEAIVTLAATPGTRLVGTGTRTRAAQSSGACAAASISSPIKDVVSPVVTDAYNPPSHYGSDFEATDGTEVVAVANGTVRAKGYQVSRDPLNRFGKVSGWGNYVLIENANGTVVLYAHLKDGSTSELTLGQEVTQGEVIARADSSGGVTSSRLHLELVPKGQVFTDKFKVDPEPCIGGNVAGSIEVGDNGSAADDAFSVKVDGLFIGNTTLGASNNLAVNNLRPGNHTLTITCTTAPDNDGTLGVVLSNGWTFTNGSSTLSDDLEQGQTKDYAFVVPSVVPNNLKGAKKPAMPKNPHSEG